MFTLTCLNLCSSFEHLCLRMRCSIVSQIQCAYLVVFFIFLTLFLIRGWLYVITYLYFLNSIRLSQFTSNKYNWRTDAHCPPRSRLSHPIELWNKFLFGNQPQLRDLFYHLWKLQPVGENRSTEKYLRSVVNDVAQTQSNHKAIVHKNT